MISLLKGGVSGPQLLALMPSCEEATAGDTGLGTSDTQASTVVRATSGTAIGMRMTPPRVNGTPSDSKRTIPRCRCIQTGCTANGYEEGRHHGCVNRSFVSCHPHHP